MIIHNSHISDYQIKRALKSIEEDKLFEESQRKVEESEYNRIKHKLAQEKYCELYFTGFYDRYGRQIFEHSDIYLSYSKMTDFGKSTSDLDCSSGYAYFTKLIIVKLTKIDKVYYIFDGDFEIGKLEDLCKSCKSFVDDIPEDVYNRILNKINLVKIRKDYYIRKDGFGKLR